MRTDGNWVHFRPNAYRNMFYAKDCKLCTAVATCSEQKRNGNYRVDTTKVINLFGDTRRNIVKLIEKMEKR